MFGTLGGPELILILVVALIVFGPRKLPEIGKSMGKMLVEFRRASTEFKRTLETEVETEQRPAAPRATATTPSVPTGAMAAGAAAGGATPPAAPDAAEAADTGAAEPETAAAPAEHEDADGEKKAPEGSVPRDTPKPPSGGDS